MSILGIVKAIKLCITILPVVLIIAAGICSIHISDGERKKFGIKKEKLKKNAKKGILFCLLFLVSFGVINFLEHRLQNSITIGLNYAEASQGLNPNGTRFNSYEIIDDEVLEQAIEDGKLGGVSVEELRAALTVEPLQADQELSTDQYYVSTEYVLNYASTFKTILLDGNSVVESVAKAFKNKFVETYSRKTDVLQLDFTKVDEADYLDKVAILEKQITGVQNYLWKCNSESAEYHNADNETFSSLATKVSDFQSVAIENLQAYILTKGLSNEKDRQLSKLGYENLIKDITYKKSIADYDVRLETIDMYERDMASIVLVPTRDDAGEFYMSRTKVAVDDFADEADTASQLAAQIQLEIQNNEYAIEQLNNSKASKSEYTTADNMVEAIKNALQNYADKALEMIEDFDSKTRGDFLVLTSNEDAFWDSFIRNEVVMGVGMLVALILFYIAVPDSKNWKRKNG